MIDVENLNPRKIVDSLDRNIIGQGDAKRSVALAFRNRWRRLRIEDDQMRAEITPKNILMVGPTGVGKTEIARRLAMLADSPFIKVEATKFTEVGFVGRDVDSIVRDLMDVAYKMAEKKISQEAKSLVEERAIDRVVSNLGPEDDAERRKLELRVKAGEMDDMNISIKVAPPPRKIGINIRNPQMVPQQMEDLSKSLGAMLNDLGAQQNKAKTRQITVADALELIEQEEMAKEVDEDRIVKQAVEMAEQAGIVFIDEIDKIAGSDGYERAQVSRQGVQRDLLPLIEGTTVDTKYGQVNTDHMLFITSGSFHYTKPSDLIPELQGRLPVRVDLSALTVNDFVRILSETQNCLVSQYSALLATEGLEVTFSDDAVLRLAEIAHAVNERQENIGARRLHTLMERLVEGISFKADTMSGEKHAFSAKEVEEAIGKLSEDEQSARIFL